MAEILHIITEEENGNWWLKCFYEDDSIILANKPNFCPMCGKKLFPEEQNNELERKKENATT